MGAFDGVRDEPVVLVALALPSLFRVREAGRALRCLSSMSGHATMLHAYAHENRDLLHGHSRTTGVMPRGASSVRPNASG